MISRTNSKTELARSLTWGGMAVLAVIVTVGCGQAGAGNAAETKLQSAADATAPRVQTVSVVPQDLARKIELPGTVEGYETADLYAKVGGFLDEIRVDIGDHVTEGQILARLSIPEMEKELLQKRAAIAAAEADVEQSKAALLESKTELREKEAQLNQQLAEFERTKGLVERGSLQEKLLEEATYKRDAAQAALGTVRARIQTAEAILKSSAAKVELAKAVRDMTQALLDYGDIRAPFDGMITKRYVHRGAFIQPAEGNSSARPLLTITRIDVVRIWFDLPMAEVRWLDRGDRVLFDRINVLPNAEFPGEVTRFATALDRTSRMMRVEIDLDNPDEQLLPGYYGYVTVFLDEMSQTAVVPSSALVMSKSEAYVYVVDENGICHRRSVSVNYQDGTTVGIESGVSLGEQVVRAGGSQLQDGQRVVAVNAGE